MKTPNNSVPDQIQYQEAHKHCFANKDEILRSKNCGCFYCISTFPTSTIKEWTDWYYPEKSSPKKPTQNLLTAICPNCLVDSVLGDQSGYPVEKEFLKKMNEYWFPS